MTLSDQIKKAQAQREQAIADAEYILTFSDQPEGMVQMWLAQLTRHKQVGWHVITKLSQRAEAMQAERKTQFDGWLV